MKVNGRPKKSAKASPNQLPLWHKDLGKQLKKGGSYFQVDILHEGLITGFLKLLESKSHFCGLAEKSVILMNKGRYNENVYSLFLHFDRKHQGKAQTIFATLFPTSEEQVSQAAHDSNIKPLPVTEWNNARTKAEALQKEIMTKNDPQEDVLFLTKCVNFNSEFQVLLKDVMLRYSQWVKTKEISRKTVPINKENKDSPVVQQQDERKDRANSVNAKREADNSLDKVAFQANAGHPVEKQIKTSCVSQEIQFFLQRMEEEAKLRKDFLAKAEKCLEIGNEGQQKQKIPELPFSKVSGGDRSESEEDSESKAQYRNEREKEQKMIGELKTRIADLEAKEKRVEELQGQFNELKGAKELSEQSQEEQINQLNVKITQLEKTLSDMQLQHKNDLEKKENENATLTAKLQKETEEFSKKINELNNLLETARSCENSNNEEFQKKLSDLEENKKEIEANNLKKIRELQTELSDSNKTNEELTNKLSNKKKEMKNALDEKNTLQKQKKETEDKLKKALETNSEYEEQNKSLKNKLEDSEKEYKKIMDKAEEKNKELRDQLASEKAENTFLRNQEQLYQICTAKLLDNRAYVNVVEGKSQQKQGRGQMSAKKKEPQEPLSAKKKARRSIEEEKQEEQEIEYLPLTKRPILDVTNLINGGQIASDNLYAYLVAKNHSVNDKFILNPNFYAKANDIVDQNLNYSLATLGLEDKDYQNLANSQYIVLPFLQKNKLWKLLVINNDQVLPLSSKHKKSTKKFEYFFFESASPRLTQDECSIILKPIDKAFCELGKLFDPNFSISTSISSIPATVLEMPQYSKDVNSGIFVAQNVEFLFDDDHPASVLAQKKYDKVYDINFSESFKPYEIILYLLQCGKYAFKLQ